MSVEVSDAQVEVIKSFLIKRKDETHWLQFPDEVADVLAALLDGGGLDALALRVSVPVGQVQRWAEERSDFLRLLKVIKDHREERGEGRYLRLSADIQKQVLGLLDYVSYRRLVKITGISQATLGFWKRKAKRPATAQSQDLALTPASTSEIAPPPPAPVTAGTAPTSIADSTEAKELITMLERHKGKVRRRYSKSEKDLIMKLVDRFGAKIVNQLFKVSFDTLARFNRERARGLPRIETKAKYAPVVDTMKRYPGMGPMQIRDYIARHHGVSMGVNSVRNAMEDNGWVASYTRKVVIDEGLRYEAIRRNYLWHLDFKHFYINKCKAYLLFIEDDFSRFIVGHNFAEGERVDEIIEALSRAIQSHGRPESLMSDGGSAFYSWRGISRFTTFLEDVGIDQIVSKVPRVNGKVESINQKFEKEVLNVQSFSSLKHFEEALIEWIGLYNFRRPHQGLSKLEVPADRYFPGCQRWLKETQTDPSELLMETLAKLLKELKKS